MNLLVGLFTDTMLIHGNIVGVASTAANQRLASDSGKVEGEAAVMTSEDWEAVTFQWSRITENMDPCDDETNACDAASDGNHSLSASGVEGS